MRTRILAVAILAFLAVTPVFSSEDDSLKPLAQLASGVAEPLMSPACKVATNASTALTADVFDFTPNEAEVAPCDSLCICCERFGHDYCCGPCAGCIQQAAANASISFASLAAE